MSAAVEGFRGLDPVTSRARDARFAVGLALGILGTAWFVLLLTQALLIRNRSFAQHRRLGWITIAIAMAVLVYGVYTSTNLVPRNLALGELTPEQIILFSLVTGADTASFVYFPTLIGLAVWYRRRMDIHMRLMFMASLGITGPAGARIASWFGELPNPVLTIIPLSLAGALVVHDIRTRGRPHWATE